MQSSKPENELDINSLDVNPPPSSSQFLQDKEKEIKCFQCGILGHYAKDCPTLKNVCFKCGKPEHHSKHCPNTILNIKCNNCGRKGHKATN